LFDVMYALPDEEPGRKYVVTPEVVRGAVKLFPRDDSAAA
jgi:ATP-dependent Clp protease ATP-binding subunit ClpX